MKARIEHSQIIRVFVALMKNELMVNGILSKLSGVIRI